MGKMVLFQMLRNNAEKELLHVVLTECGMTITVITTHLYNMQCIQVRFRL